MDLSAAYTGSLEPPGRRAARSAAVGLSGSCIVAPVIGRVLGALLFSALLAGVWSAVASAETICVRLSSPACTAPVEQELQPALTRAVTQPGIDTVDIGPGEYATSTTSGFSYASNDPIIIQGAGAGRTILRGGVEAPRHVLSVSVPAGQATAETSVAGISVVAGDLTGPSSAAQIAGKIENADFTAVSTDAAAADALATSNGSTVAHAQVDAFGPDAVGIAAAGLATVVDSVVHATIGVAVSPGGEGGGLTLQRTRLFTSEDGIQICNATALAEDDAIQITGGIAVNVEGATRCGGESSQFTGRNLTITGAGGEDGGVGLEASAATSDPTVALSDSILWELTTAIRAQPAPGGATTLHVARLAEDPAALQLGGDGGALLLTDDGGNVGDPELLDPAQGNLDLSPDSPAIDAGLPGPLAPGESTTDLEGAPRVQDGNGDGIARRDIGAIESPSLVPALAPKSVPGDLIAPRLSDIRLRRGRHPHLEVISSEAGRIRLTLKGLPRGCRHISARCRVRTLATQADPIRRGSNNIALAGGLASSLKRATGLQVMATDFAGNRSAVRSLRA